MSDAGKNRRHKAPTGMNILGETQAEYYARVANERGAEIERLRAELLGIARMGVDMKADFSRSADQSRIAREALS